MIRLALAFVGLLLSLAACASDHVLGKCDGPLVVMNSDRWQPSPSEVAALERACPPEGR